MPFTSDDVQQQIILEVGDVDPQTGDPPSPASNGIIASRIDYLWDRYAAWDGVGAGLRELYCRAAAIRLVLGVFAPRRFDHSDGRSGLSVRANQLYTNYLQMLDHCNQEIARAKAAAGVGTGSVNSPTSGYQSGRLAYRTPLPAHCPPDPNAARYGGMLPNADPNSGLILDEVP